MRRAICLDHVFQPHGWVIAAKDVTMISIRSVSRYNALVKPEDKVF
ncbi:hypothetical protein C7S15_1269 [Burkholderia cepacia]|nr:hypothetical protein [Burkholderia cepacia]